jgi:NIPSNAP
MVIDHRTYTFHPLKMPKWLALYEEYGVQLKHLGNLIGFFQNEIGTLNQVAHLWALTASTTGNAAAPKWQRTRPGMSSCAATKSSAP